MKKVVGLLVVLLMCGAVLFGAGVQETAAPAVAEVASPNPELDPMYKDRNGDWIADTPDDPKDILDPETLIFAYAPVEDPAVYEDVFADFLTHLQKVTGKKIMWFGVKNYATQVEAMRAGRLHISGFAAGSVQDAVNEGGFIPLATMGAATGITGYRMAIITGKDSPINKVEDLKGKNVAFVSETSNSGYFAPRAILYEEFGMLPKKDYLTRFSGSHDNSILGVFNKDYDAAAIADSVLLRMVMGGRVPDPASWMKIIFESPVFPPTAYGVSHRLKPELVAKIKEAFLTYDWTGTKFAEQWPDNDRFIPVDYVKAYEVLRKIRQGSAKVAELAGN